MSACEQCGHPFDPHVVIATMGDAPEAGGIVLCPRPGCLCYSTWGVNGAEPLVVPSPEEVVLLRAEVQDPR